MSNTQENLTDKEMKDLQGIVAETLASACAMADKHNIDRDSMLKYFADTLTAFAEVASIQNYETNYTCNCQHNNNSRDNEPCCRCDNRMTNAGRIRNMSDEELTDTLFNSCLEVMHIDECPYADNVGMCKKCILDWLQSEAE